MRAGPEKARSVPPEQKPRLHPAGVRGEFGWPAPTSPAGLPGPVRQRRPFPMKTPSLRPVSEFRFPCPHWLVRLALLFVLSGRPVLQAETAGGIISGAVGETCAGSNARKLQTMTSVRPSRS